MTFATAAAFREFSEDERKMIRHLDSRLTGNLMSHSRIFATLEDLGAPSFIENVRAISHLTTLDVTIVLVSQS